MNKVKPNILLLTVAIIYFLFNSFLLPQGLLYTTLLTPILFISLIKTKGLKIYAYFLAITLLLFFIQFTTIDFLRDYLMSFILFQTTAIFTILAYYKLNEDDSLQIKNIYKVLSITNMLFLLLALITLSNTILSQYLWSYEPISPDLPIIPRLKMLSYEPSFYSLMLVPIFSFYGLRKIFLQKTGWWLLITLIISLLLSFSFGVISFLIISFSLVFALNIHELIRKVQLNYLSLSIIILIAVMLAVIYYFPDNILFERVKNIVSGKDTSARGRTREAFYIAWNIAKMKSIWWGSGLGQLKSIGRDFIVTYYSYSQIPTVVRIPNAVAETLCIYGISGLIIRFTIQFYLFFKSRVWNNYYRSILFLFMFLYQFTGSYIFNLAEYMIWVLAFSPSLFKEFENKLIENKIR